MEVQNNSNQAFTARIINNKIKRSCDRLAKRMLTSGNKDDVKEARKYFKNIQKVKAEKRIDTVEFRDIWCPGEPSFRVDDLTETGYCSTKIWRAKGRRQSIYGFNEFVKDLKSRIKFNEEYRREQSS